MRHRESVDLKPPFSRLPCAFSSRGDFAEVHGVHLPADGLTDFVSEAVESWLAKRYTHSGVAE